MRIVKYLEILLKFPFNILMLIVLSAFAIRIYNLNFNSIFIDEAFYVVIGQKILEGRIGDVIGDIYWVGAFPFFYPFFSGLFYNIGGIIGTRFFNVVLGTISVVLVYFFVVQLNLFKKKESNQISGLIAAGFMATTAIPIEASRLAIYDGLTFTLLLFGLNIYLKAVEGKDRVFYMLTAFVFFLSFLAKYIVAILFPIIFLTSVFLTRDSKKKKYTKDVIKFLWFPLLILCLLYLYNNISALINFFSTQVGDPSTTYVQVAQTIWKYSSIAFALSLIGAVFLWESKKMYVVGLYLLAVTPILVHIISKNDSNAHQHTFLVLIFLFPLVGACFTVLTERYKKIGLLIAAVAIIINLVYSIPHVKDLEGFWPNSDKAVSVIRERVLEKDRILVEGDDTIMLGINKKIPPEQISGPFGFDYKGQVGETAYVRAIEDGYFKLVELENVYFSTETFNLISTALPKKYVKIFDDGRIQVYERKK